VSRLRVQFIHGLEGSPRGAKARLLAKHFCARTPAMDTRDFAACVEVQAAALHSFCPDVLVGSSFGGAVAVELLRRGLWRGPTLLLAQAAVKRDPRVRLPEGVPVWLVHGRRDDIVDPEDSRALAQTGTASLVRLIEVDDDHPLHATVRGGRLSELVRELASAGRAPAGGALPRAAAPEAVGLDSAAVGKLVSRLRRFVESGAIPSGQLAIAREGRLAATATFGEVSYGDRRGPATDDTLYAAFSTTKAITSSGVWLLLQDGKLRLEDRVADLVPEFAANGKQAVCVEHLLTHTAGFPSAPFDALEWDDRERRLARFASWRLEWEPGERFQYHPDSSMWVLAELIERTSGRDFRAFLRSRICDPLGLPDLHVGLPAELNSRVADIVQVGQEPDPDALRASGLEIAEQFTGADGALLRFNRPAIRAVGVPSGGVITNAGTFALFYQALLRDGRGTDGTQVWEPRILREAFRVRTGRLTDPMTGFMAKRGLGVVIAGGEHRIFRSFAPGNSPEAFGHAGAGGQLAWGDPASGISFVFFTNGCDRDPLAMGSRGIALSDAAVRCVRSRETE
jgi:CubicO group peptidase (beta-lactamase class C family)